MISLLKRIGMLAVFSALAGAAFAQYSAMQQAVVNGDKAAVKNLLDTGYAINSVEEVVSTIPRRKKMLVTPLQMALHYRQVDIAKMMIEDYHADINFVTYQTALHEALWGDIDLLSYLISKGAEPNHRNDMGDTPLHIICSSRDWPQAVDLLLKHGASINSKGMGGTTPLHNAAYLGYLGDMQALIDNQVKLNERDRNGNTPLHLAVKAGNTDAAKLLIMAGAKTNIKNYMGQTVTDIAESGNVYQSMYIKAIIKQTKEKQEMQKLQDITKIIKGSDKKEIKGI